MIKQIFSDLYEVRDTEHGELFYARSMTEAILWLWNHNTIPNGSLTVDFGIDS